MQLLRQEQKVEVGSGYGTVLKVATGQVGGGGRVSASQPRSRLRKVSGSNFNSKVRRSWLPRRSGGRGLLRIEKQSTINLNPPCS
jgi:hypothetical protein